MRGHVKLSANAKAKFMKHFDLKGEAPSTVSEAIEKENTLRAEDIDCLLYTSPSPRDGLLSRMPSSA